MSGFIGETTKRMHRRMIAFTAVAAVALIALLVRLWTAPVLNDDDMKQLADLDPNNIRVHYIPESAPGDRPPEETPSTALSSLADSSQACPPPPPQSSPSSRPVR